MDNWKIVSIAVKSLVLANLMLILGVFSIHASRPIAIKMFWAFKVCSLVLLLLVPAEYVLRRAAGARQGGLILDALLSLLMFGIWFTISAATF